MPTFKCFGTSKLKIKSAGSKLPFSLWILSWIAMFAKEVKGRGFFYFANKIKIDP